MPLTEAQPERAAAVSSLPGSSRLGPVRPWAVMAQTMAWGWARARCAASKPLVTMTWAAFKRPAAFTTDALLAKKYRAAMLRPAPSNGG